MTLTPYSSINNKVEVFKESVYGGGIGTAVEFGFIQSYNKKADTHSEVVYSLDGNATPNAIVDGVMEFSGTMEWLITSGAELECIFGSYSGGSLTVSNTLPSYAILSYEDPDTNHLLKGVKFSKITLDVAKDRFLSAKGDFFGRVLVEDSTSITPQTPTTTPFFFTDGYISIGGTDYEGIDSMTIEIDRKTTPYRGIQSASIGEKRLITHLIEGVLSVTFSGTMVVRKQVYEELMGGSSLTDERSDKSIVLNFSNGSKSLSITITGRFTTYDKKEEVEQDVVLVDFSGVGVSITGSVS